MGDLKALEHSIQTFGLIQPIVLARDAGDIILVAGGRRLAVLKRLGYSELQYGKHFVWKDDTIELPDESAKLILRGCELEENIRRKSLHWAEEINSKKQLFELMQTIYGKSKKGFGAGKRTESDGFSLRRLAVMLGEHSSQTSRDLQLAELVTQHPLLARMPTKADALRKMGVAYTIATMQQVNKLSPSGSVTPPSAAPLTASAASPSAVSAAHVRLYEGPFESNIASVPDASIDLVLTDLPYVTGQSGPLGTGPGVLHSASFTKATFAPGGIDLLLTTLARESYRILRQDRYAVIFYGASHHCGLLRSLGEAGFDVDPIPFIWLRHRTGAPYGGLSRYDPSYDQAFVARKGDPKFVRPNQPNYMQFPSVSGAARVHPAQKPIEVMLKFIQDMLTPGCTVLDMFAGSGTTAVAARQAGMHSILFELDPANCQIIRARLGIL